MMFRVKKTFIEVFFFLIEVLCGRENDDVTVCCHQTGLYTLNLNNNRVGKGDGLQLVGVIRVLGVR